MRECEGTGKNIEVAIQNALFELKAPREDVDIKIISEGGFLKKARVLVSISEDALYKYEKKEKEVKENNDISDEDLNDEDFIKNFINNKISRQEKKVEEKVETPVEVTEEPAKEEPTTEEKVEEEIEVEIYEEKVETVNEKKEKVEKYIDPIPFLEGLLKVIGIDGTVTVKEDENFITYCIDGEDISSLIGHRGECLFALAHILKNGVKRSEKRVSLDIGGYREKRQETLEALAHRVADKVAKSGRYTKLEPMDASERKIIHTALQNDDRVTTLSKGVEPHRYLMVFPRDYTE